jgi:NodT family efflux transporter outer membrane factor (OMF) lipoprotein
MMARLGALAILAALAMVASCVGRSPRSSKGQLNVDTPGKYQAGEREGRAIADVKWIDTFGDSKLNALVKEAERNNRDIAAAVANIDIAAARARSAGSDLYPHLEGLATGRRADQKFIGLPLGPLGSGGAVPGNLNNEFGVSLDLSWELDLWGRVRAGQSASIAELEASQADSASLNLSIGAQTAKAWFALIEARQQEDLARRTVEVFGKTEKILRNQFELGAGDGQKGLAAQLRLAMSDLATAREALTRHQQQVEQISRQLEVLLGRYPRGEMSSGLKLPGMPKTPPAGIPASLLDRRPDLVASERRLAATDKRILEAKLSVLPRISLTGAAGRSSGDLQSIFDNDFSVWSFAGRAAQPIFEGGQIREAYNIRKGEAARALADFEKTALVAFQEVEDALAAERFLVQREQSLREAARLAEEAYKTADDEYANGVGDVLTMLTAQRQMVLRESESLLIRRLRLDNRVNLHLALGGDFRERTKE